jgi:hypothetical protein
MSSKNYKGSDESIIRRKGINTSSHTSKEIENGSSGQIKTLGNLKVKNSKKRAPRSTNLPIPNKEQQDIINKVLKGYNVVVNADPGVGKTRNVFQIANSMPNIRIAQITFNRNLKMDVKKDAYVYKIPSLCANDIYTYHSFALHNYGAQDAVTDEGIIRILEQRLKPVKELSIDLLVVDEMQDMRDILCLFILKVIEDIYKCTKKYPQLIFLGDQNQGVYEFLGSRVAYLTQAHNIFNTHEFSHMRLRFSYRLTDQIAAFVNNYALGEKRIMTDRKGPKVRIMTRSAFGKPAHTIAWDIRRAMAKYQLGNGDIAVIFPTLHNKSGLRTRPNLPFIPQDLENLLVSKGHKVFYPTSDDQELVDNVIYGKIVFSTPHQAKGRGWPYVFIANIGGSYCDMFKLSHPEILPSPIYVGLTRSSLVLTVWMNDSIPPWAKMTRSELYNTSYSKLIEDQPVLEDVTYDPDIREKTAKISVTRLCTYLSSNLTQELDELISPMFEVVTEKSSVIKIPSNIKISKIIEYQNESGDIVDEKEYFTWEYVADKTGNAILHIYDLYEQLNGGDTWLVQRCRELTQLGKNNEHYKLLESQIGKDMKLSSVTNVTAASSIVDHYDASTLSSPTIIDNFDWIEKSKARRAVKRLQEVLNSKNLVREHVIEQEIDVKDSDPIVLVGRIDAITKSCVWEFKFVDHVSTEHKLQLLLYWWIWDSIAEEREKTFHLYNIKDGEDYVLHPNKKIITKVLVKLIRNYQDEKISESPTETVSLIREGMKKYKIRK